MKTQSIKREALRNALLAATFFLLLALVRGIGWESNDDPTISLLLSRQGEVYSPFQGKLLTAILHLLYVHFPIVDWWSVCSLFGIWAGTFATVYVLHNRYPRETAWVLTVLYFPLLWCTSLDMLNFTRTAIVIAGGGAMLILLGVHSKERGAVRCTEFVLGCFLMLFGSSVRSMCGLLALAFLALGGGISLLRQQISFRPAWWKAHAREILLLCVCAALVLGVQFGERRLLTAAEREYNEYNAARANVEDYVDRYPSWEEAKDAYAAIGLDGADVHVLLNWFTEDTERYTTETFREFAELGDSISSPKQVLSIYLGCVKANLPLTLLLLVTLPMLPLLGRKRNAWFLPPLAAAVLCGLYLCWVGRLPARVYASIVYIAFCTAIYLCGETIQPIEERAGGGILGWLRRFFDFRRLFRLCLVLMFCAAVLLGCCGWGYVWVHADATKTSRYNLWSTSEVRQRVRSKTFDQIDADREHLYICDIGSALGSYADAFGFWEPRPVNYCENRFDLGGWDARHPNCVERLAEYGIQNPVRALYERDDVYSTYSARVEQLLRFHYDARITTSYVKKLDRCSIVRYTAPVEDTEITERVDFTPDEFRYRRMNGAIAWYMTGAAPAGMEDAEELYCNLTYRGVRYTYCLTRDGDTFSACFYDLPEAFDAAHADLVFFTK